MTPIAILFLVISIVIVWGGLLASVLYLRKRPESAPGAGAGAENGARE